jgi:thiamine biosynthesis lipoprotein
MMHERRFVRIVSWCVLLLASGAPVGCSGVRAKSRQSAPITHREPTDSPVVEGDEITKTTTARGADLLREWRGGVMGTSFQIEAMGTDEAELDRVLGLVLDELLRVEDVFTVWRESELTLLNDRAGQGPIPVSREMAELLALSVECGRVTHGAFDVSYFPLRPLWNYKTEHPTLPTQAEIDAALRFVDYGRIDVDLEKSTVEMPEGFRIDLGGIAKGYGIDRAMQVMLDQRIENGLVQAGGDTKALGRKFGDPWQIAIKNPRHRGQVFAVLPVVNQCVQTSGDYERYFEIDGQRYHHIIDPRTGRPSQGCMSATVIGPEATFGDGIATAMCVLGPEAGMAIIEKLDRVEAVLVGMDGEVHLSSGLQRSGLPRHVR